MKLVSQASASWARASGAATVSHPPSRPAWRRSAISRSRSTGSTTSARAAGGLGIDPQDFARLCPGRLLSTGRLIGDGKADVASQVVGCALYRLVEGGDGLVVMA
jgi:hypothetical protein